MKWLSLILFVGLCAPLAGSERLGLTVAADSKIVLKGERPGSLSVFQADDLRRVGGVFLGGIPRDISVVGNLAYVACESGLKVVDFGSASSPAVIGSYLIPGGASGVVVTGGRACVLGTKGGLHLLDVKNPANPTEISVYESIGESFRIAVVGTRAYLAKGSAGVEIVNVANPETPQFMKRFDVGGEAFGLVVSGGFAYVACGSGGLKIFDVKDALNPSQLGIVNSQGTEIEVTLLDQIALVVASEGGVHIVDVSIPSTPVLKATATGDCLAATGGVGHRVGGKDLILDCDPGNDIDDVGDLAVLHQLANDGEANIFAVMYSMAPAFGAPIIEIVNRANGRPDIPIGVSKTSRFLGFDCYGSHLMTNFFNSIGASANATDAVSLYRKILAARADRSVTIVIAGQLRNMSDLWRSGPDVDSPLTGRELLIQKVERMIVVAGIYPQGQEYNFYTDPASASVVNEWNGTGLPVSFMGIENGDQVFIGGTVLSKPVNDPVREGYATFYPVFHVNNRQAWTGLALMFATRGYSFGGTELFTATKGRVLVSATDGKNDWTNEPGSNVEYLRMSQAPSYYETFLDGLLMRAPLQGAEPRAYVAEEGGGMRAFKITNAAEPFEFAQYTAPRLEIAKSGEEIIVKWPASFADYSLWTLDAISGNWQKVTSGIETAGGGYRFSMATGNAAQYFQLRR